MKSMLSAIQVVFATICGWFFWALGGTDNSLIILIIFICMDYITGIIRSMFNKKLSSSIGARGIIKKVLIFAVVSIGYLIDNYLLAGKSALRTVIILFYISNEGISILENLTDIGVPIPKQLSDVLEQVRKKHPKK